MAKQSIEQIPLHLIDQKENSRVDINDERLSELMTSMKQTGLLQPIGVVQTGKRFECVFGNRRLEAAKKLGWKTINALLRPQSDNVAKLVDNAVENMQRADVPFAQQGRIFSQLLKEGLTNSEIASRIGVPKSTVVRYLELFHQIPTKYQKRITTGQRPGKSDKKGKLPGVTAFRILNISKTARLSSAQTEKLLDAATEDGFRTENVNVVGKLIKAGHEFSEALDLAQEYKPIVLSLMISEKAIQAIEKKSGGTIHNYLYKLLAKDQNLGLGDSMPMLVKGTGNNNRGK